MLRKFAAILVACTATLVLTSTAHAGQWIDQSCVDSFGNPAPTSGWSTGAGVQSGACLSASVHGGSSAAQSSAIAYKPPAGSKIAGGTVGFDVGIEEEPGLSGTFRGEAAEASNALPPNTLYYCTTSAGTCTGDEQQVTIPKGYTEAVLSVGCSAGTGTQGCGGAGSSATIYLDSSSILLTNSATPGGTNFNGTVLTGPHTGTEDLTFTATDTDGPGVSTVTATIDGNAIYSQGPAADTTCVPTGTSSGVPMYDGDQPCPVSEAVDVPIDTTKLTNGTHELTVTVTDAAGNTAQVYDATITVSDGIVTATGGGSGTTGGGSSSGSGGTTSTSNSGSTSSTSTSNGDGSTTTRNTVTPKKPKKGSKHRYVLATVNFTWIWKASSDRLSRFTLKNLAAHSTVQITCSGSRRCPGNLGKTSSKLKLKTLLKHLYADTFVPGETLSVTLAHKGETAERIHATIRTGKAPTVKLL